jgi:hypothetical protein
MMKGHKIRQVCFNIELYVKGFGSVLECGVVGVATRDDIEAFVD